MAVMLAFALIPLAMLLALLGLYAFVFRRVNSPAFRVGLSVFALGFIFTELYTLYVIVIPNDSQVWRHIELLPIFKAIKKYFDVDNYFITMPFWFFLLCGLLASGITFFMNRLIKKPIKTQQADSQLL